MSKLKKMIILKKNRDRCMYVCTYQKLHFCAFPNQPEVNVDMPSLKDLCEVAHYHATHWKEIGTLLGLPSEALNIIEKDNMYRVLPCCYAMLQKWLEVDPNASWPTWFKAVAKIFISGENIEAGMYAATYIILNNIVYQKIVASF